MKQVWLVSGLARMSSSDSPIDSVPRWRAWLPWLAALLPAVLLAILISRNQVNALFMDDWHCVEMLEKHEAGTVTARDYFAGYLEHRGVMRSPGRLHPRAGVSGPGYPRCHRLVAGCPSPAGMEAEGAGGCLVAMVAAFGYILWKEQAWYGARCPSRDLRVLPLWQRDLERPLSSYGQLPAPPPR